MPNISGSLFGLTVLCPILDEDTATPSHDLQIRLALANLPTDERSPFALAPGTHLTRLAVLDDVIYVGMPSCEEHLQSKYLVWECNLDAASDAALDTYLDTLASTVPQQLDSIWSHCVGYPGAANRPAFVAYIRSCQIETTFFFAAVNERSLPQAIKALQTQHAVTAFIADHQGLPAAQLQRDFLSFASALAAEPTPLPGSMAPHRDTKTGGHNE